MISGESGAGKSLLFQAIRYCLGGNIDKSYIGVWSDEMHVSIIFKNIVPVSIYEDYDIPVSDKVSISHTLRQKSRACHINGKKVSQSVLKHFKQYLILDSKQSQSQQLLKPSFQAKLIDQSIDQSLIDDYHQAYQSYQSLFKRSEEIAKILIDAEDKEWLSYQLKELEECELTEDSYEVTSQEIKQIQDSQLLQQQWPDIQAQLYQVKKSIQRINSVPQAIDDQFKGYSAYADSLMSDVEHYLHSDQASRYTYELLQQKMTLLNDLARKHRVAPSQLYAVHQSLVERKEEISVAESEQASVLSALQNAKKVLTRLDKTFMQAREKEAQALEKWIKPNLLLLGMENATLMIQLPVLSEKMDTEIQYQMQTNPGQCFKDIKYCLSGGELSRLNLLLMVYMGDKRTMLLDEVDAGVSGVVGHKIRQLLVGIAKQRQVVAISHLAQVALGANDHYMVEKQVLDQQVLSSIRQLMSTESRYQELARLMCGIVNDSSTEKAKMLLSELT